MTEISNIQFHAWRLAQCRLINVTGLPFSCYSFYLWGTKGYVSPEDIRNLGVISRLVFFLPSQAAIASFKPLEPQSLIWAILTYRDPWGSDETKVVLVLSYKQRCFILKWVLCIFTIIFCLPPSPRALLTSISPSGCLGLLTLSIPTWDTFFIISPLSLASLLRAQTIACLVMWHFPLWLTLVDPRGSSFGPVWFSAPENLFLQRIPGRLLPSWSVARRNNDSHALNHF